MNRFIAFQMVVRLGSFTKAAKALGYTQSSVSQLVASLEEELGIQLLVRAHDGIRLTREGQKIYPLILQSIQRYQAVQSTAAELKGLNQDVIRIGTISSITCHWLPQLIKDFKRQYPHVEFVMYQGDYDSIAEWLRTGVIDIGFTTPAMANGLEIIPLKKGEMQAILPANHPLSREAGRPLPLEKLAAAPLILLEEGSYSEPLNAFKAANLMPRVEYRIHDDYAIMTMVEAGLGVSILAKLVLERMPFKIVRRPLQPRLLREIGIAFRSQQELPLASQYFIEVVLDKKDQLP